MRASVDWDAVLTSRDLGEKEHEALNELAVKQGGTGDRYGGLDEDEDGEFEGEREVEGEKKSSAEEVLAPLTIGLIGSFVSIIRTI